MQVRFARNQLQRSFLAGVAGVGGVFPVSVFPVWVLCFRSLGSRAYVVFDSFQGTRGKCFCLWGILVACFSFLSFRRNFLFLGRCLVWTSVQFVSSWFLDSARNYALRGVPGSVMCSRNPVIWRRGSSDRAQ